MKTPSGESWIQQIESRLAPRRPGIITQCADTRVSAVLVPLVQAEEGEWGLLFERRAASLRRHSGEVAFPGGHFESADGDLRTTALRETCEELQTPVTNLQILADLDVLATWSGLLVHPFLGRIHDLEQVTPSPSEVAEVFWVSLQRLFTLDPKVYDLQLTPVPSDDFPFHWISGGRQHRWRKMVARQLFYEVDGQIIWGMTARILEHTLQLLKAFPQS
ncbi:MAG: CoA pyrophosphatase [Alicyclobacillus herbarius]|uniref:NUDIX hydrolase n=1 Tax=Alicyclobacillus herbarius TaxID=122960 RepID=UPI00235303E6|nr:CoA pyrophosphatase [Alicyclobacillus herbarius]MCL6634044.1 CoA pyrophosphatase [Alicyclobacillus herbarius]